MTQYKPYYRSKVSNVQVRKNQRDSKIMTFAFILFACFAFLGMGFAFSFVVRHITSLIL